MNIKINQTMSEFLLALALKKLAKEIIGTDKIHNTSRNAIAKVNEVLAEAMGIKVNKNKSLTNLIKDTKKISKAERKPIVDPEPEKDSRMTRWYLNGVLVKETLIEGDFASTDNPRYFDSCEIGSSVTSIENKAFSGCSGLTSITIPNSVTSIGSYAFFDCLGLTSITIPNSVTSIEWSAFGYCRGLTSVTIPNSVTSIGESAFNGCSGLTSVTIPNSVTSIGSYAFNDCSGLTSITIPNSVTSIEWLVFLYCTNLEEIIYGDTVEKFKLLTTGVFLLFHGVPLGCTIVCTDDIIHLADIIDDISNPGGSGSGSGSDNGSGSN